MNIIDMSQVISSDTLRVPRKGLHLDHDDICEHVGSREFYSNYIMEDGGGLDFSDIEVAENIWQSTANNLVIPDGLICDVSWIDNKGVRQYSEGLTNPYLTKRLNSEMLYKVDSIRVTGKQEGWRYAWEGE